MIKRKIPLCLLPGNQRCSNEITLLTFSNRWNTTNIWGCFQGSKHLPPYLSWLIFPPDTIVLDGGVVSSIVVVYCKRKYISAQKRMKIGSFQHFRCIFYHVVDWFHTVIKIAPVWDEALICLKWKLMPISRILIDPSEMSNSNNHIFLGVVPIVMFSGLLALLHSLILNPKHYEHRERSKSQSITIQVWAPMKPSPGNHVWPCLCQWHRWSGYKKGQARGRDE